MSDANTITGNKDTLEWIQGSHSFLQKALDLIDIKPDQGEDKVILSMLHMSLEFIAKGFAVHHKQRFKYNHNLATLATQVVQPINNELASKLINMSFLTMYSGSGRYPGKKPKIKKTLYECYSQTQQVQSLFLKAMNPNYREPIYPIIKFHDYDDTKPNFIEYESEFHTLKGFLPYKLNPGSCALIFKKASLRNSVFTFDSQEILNNLFQGFNFPIEKETRGPVVFLKEKTVTISFNHTRLELNFNEARVLFKSIDLFAKKYLNQLKYLDQEFLGTQYFQKCSSEENVFHVLTIHRDLWSLIIKFSQSHDYLSGSSNWHIFNATFSDSCLQIFPEHKKYNLTLLIYLRVEDLTGPYLKIGWRPHLFGSKKIWTAKQIHLWLIKELIPQVLSFYIEKRSFLYKSIERKMAENILSRRDDTPHTPHEFLCDKTYGTLIEKLELSCRKMQSVFLGSNIYISSDATIKLLEALIFALKKENNKPSLEYILGKFQAYSPLIKSKYDLVQELSRKISTHQKLHAINADQHIDAPLHAIVSCLTGSKKYSLKDLQKIQKLITPLEEEFYSRYELPIKFSNTAPFH